MGQIENIIILCAIGMFATCLVACALEAFIVYFAFRDGLNNNRINTFKNWFLATTALCLVFAIGFCLTTTPNEHIKTTEQKEAQK